MSATLAVNLMPEANTGGDDLWDILPPSDLPLEDGEPLETNQHRIAMDALIRCLKYTWADRQDFFTGGNMFIYFSELQVRNKDYRGPDFFVVLDIDGSYSRQTWITWKENGRYPDVIVELLSPSTKQEDLGKKKSLYERIFKTSNYFVFDLFKANSLQGWNLTEKGYQPLLPNEPGWLWSEPLGMWLGPWTGKIENESGTWLRFYDKASQLVPLPEEAEKQKADLAEQHAQEAQRQAQEAQRQAQEAQQRTARAEQRAAKLAEQLRALGIEPANCDSGPGGETLEQSHFITKY